VEPLRLSVASRREPGLVWTASLTWDLLKWDSGTELIGVGRFQLETEAEGREVSLLNAVFARRYQFKRSLPLA
jgi:hypothetical protein